MIFPYVVGLILGGAVGVLLTSLIYNSNVLKKLKPSKKGNVIYLNSRRK